MKIEYLVVGVLSLLTPLAAAWSKEGTEHISKREPANAGLYRTDESALSRS